MRRVAVISGCVAFALVVAGVALFRSDVVMLPGQRTPRSESQQRAASVESARERMASLEMIDRSEVDGPSGVRAVLGPLLSAAMDRVADGQSPSLSGERLRTISDETVGLVAGRWLQDSGDAYAASRRQLGYELMSLETMVTRWAVDHAYERATGEPIPEGADPAMVFEAVWSSPPPAPRSMITLDALCADPAGVEVAVGRYCPGESERWPVLGGALGESVWNGAGAVGFTMLHTAPGGSWEARRAAGECFETATVGVVLGFEGGVRIPLRLHYWFDERAGRWWLGQVTASNMPEGFGGVTF
ncbi:MAG: hypothetical protein ACIARR_09770 [Phycisphaerales bacterium JB059]